MRDPARILVVDDVADNVEILRMRLTSLGYEVVVASDGEEALAAVAKELPDLVHDDVPNQLLETNVPAGPFVEDGAAK